MRWMMHCRLVSQSNDAERPFHRSRAMNAMMVHTHHSHTYTRPLWIPHSIHVIGRLSNRHDRLLLRISKNPCNYDSISTNDDTKGTRAPSLVLRSLFNLVSNQKGVLLHTSRHHYSFFCRFLSQRLCPAQQALQNNNNKLLLLCVYVFERKRRR
jgi:hypothetical protein